MAQVCIHIPAYPDPQRLTLPGGIQIEAINLTEVIQPALTPLVPLFQIVDAVVAVFNCVKAIKDAVASLDPTKIDDCIKDLATKTGKLLQLLPQLSLPLTVLGLIDLLLLVISQVRGQLLHLRGELSRLTGVVDRAKELDDPCLLAIGDCTRFNIEREAANIGAQLASLGRLIGLLNLFLGMIGAPEVPDFSELSGKPIDEVLPALEAIEKTLRSVRSGIPLP